MKNEREAFEAWFKTAMIWNSAITWRAWQAACAWQKAESAKACDSVVDQSNNALFRSGAKICAGQIRSTVTQQPDRCTRAPEGWICTRDAGHDGPCAALFDAEEHQGLIGYDKNGDAVFGTIPPGASSQSLTCQCGYDRETSCNVLDPTCRATRSSPKEPS